MKSCLLSLVFLLVFVQNTTAQSHTYTDEEGKAAWTKFQRQSITETTFRQVCDLIQDIGQTNLGLAYILLAQYVEKVRKTGNRQWVHVLFINWGKGYESLNQYPKADSLFRLARQNAWQTSPKAYCDALTYTVQLYFDWDKPDSLRRYLAIGEQIARRAHDRETLSFLRTYRATSRIRAGQPDSMRADFNEAIRLATGLPNKNALFMARYSWAATYLTNPQQQVMAFDSLLELTNDSSLVRNPRFYERTTVYFRSPRPTVLFKLAQLNLLLTDYDNAGKFADMVYDALVRPNPKIPSAPYFNAEMAIIRMYQNQISQARSYVDSSRQQFGGSETNIPYSGYFLAAGLLAEHDGQLARAANYYQQSLTKGVTSASFSPIPPELYYARALIRTGNYDKARQMLLPLATSVSTNQYSATGLYYYQLLAELEKAQRDYRSYGEIVGVYYAIRDSLTNLNQYRAVQQILARVRIRDKEQQISRLNAENATRTAQFRRERLFYGIIIALALLAIGLLMLYVRNRQVRARQREALQQSQLEQLEKQRQIDLMQGVMQAEENERLSIADQLHNEVNPMLAVVLLNVSSALETIPANESPNPKLRKAQDVLTSVSSTVRGISHRLTPQLIEQQGFKRAVEELAESVNLSKKVSIQAIVIGFETALPLPFLSDLYRILQELVHNVIRHAQATQATVEVIEHDHYVTIVVEDNGVGIPDDAVGDGQGLQTIRAKVALRHGQMDVQRKADGGTLIVIDNLELPPSTKEVA
ncbi:tetratricopeptide repeat-containing sensor histidine kinase [Spirosoma spitsbergense]|uniref:tetratricopeptide repeat-containing sensor histidine kinase n=1 Tax=Spirosoma spitsbergense TaxID=431554 RepID=UPI0003679EC4|nr:ATP-binding protein [Spirosoma spitsbergense]